MKKKTFTFLLFLALISSFKAQIPNASFENLNTNNSIKNWGGIILLAFVLDSSGNQTDSLKLDHDFYFSTNDAHTGLKALEMRNAYWINSGEQIAGRARLTSNDSDYSAFSSPLPIGTKPVDFSFYYKFFPVNNDTAFAYLTLTDNAFNVVGEAKINIYGLHTNYVLSNTSIIYSDTTSPAFIEIGFYTAKPYSAASYGTRFLVDDVNTVTTSTLGTTGLAPVSMDTKISCFPNPADKEVNLLLKKTGADENFLVQLITTEGKRIDDLVYFKEGNLLKINTEGLSPGLYFINVMHQGYTYTAKFAKTE